MRLIPSTLFLLTSCLLIGQSFPERPNKYSADSLRIGEWITFYDSLGNEIPRESLDISHYCLMEISNGNPFGQIECFYENGIRSWTGRMISIDPEIKQGRALGYHKNGAIWSRAFYENDTIQGTYTSYYPNGILESEGEMVDGKKAGKWVYFYDNGNPIATVDHIAGMESGPVTIYYKSGKLNSKGTMTNNEKNGYWETYFESGALANKGNFVNERREGEWIYYHENGEIQDIGVYKDDKEEGNHKKYFSNGQLETNGHYKNGSSNGFFEYFYENGVLKSKGVLINGLYQGGWVFYYDNGQKESEGSYIDDEKDGLWKYYFKNGAFNSRINYKNGKENGDVAYYYDNGVLNAKGNFVDGSKHGEWRYYFSNATLQGIETYEYGVLNGYKELRNQEGKVSNRGTYKNEKQHGLWEFFYDNGQISTSENYENGVSQGPILVYYEDGTLKREGSYLNNQRDGLWKYYYSNGQPSAIGDYKEGNSTGTWKYYFDNGALKSEGEEFADKKFGDWTYYRRNGNLKSKEPYVDGRAHGMLTFYDTLGNFKSKEQYINGVGQTFSTFYDSVNSLCNAGKFELAKQTLEAADKAYYESFEKDALKKTDLYELYASFYRKNGEYKKAIKYIKKSLNHALKFKDDTSVWYTATLDDLGDIYTDMREYEKATETYEVVLKKIRERPNGIYSDEYAIAVRYYATTLMNLKKTSEAIGVLNKDLTFRKNLSNQNYNIAANYFGIIDAHYPNLSPELDTAISHSLTFHEQNDMKARWTYAYTLYNKALIHRDRKQSDESYATFKSYVDIVSANRDTVDARFVNALIHLGNYHYDKLQYNQSRPFYYRAIELGKNPKIENSWIYLNTVVSISNQVWADDDYESTLKYNQLLLDIAGSKSDTSRIGQAYTGIALAYDNLGEEYRKEAKENHLKAIKELSLFNEYNVHYVNAHLHYANHLDDNNQDNEEYEVLQKTKNHITSFSKIDSTYLFRTYYQLASNFYEQYKYDSTLHYAQKIIDNLKQKPGSNLQQYLQAFRVVGDVYSDKNENEKASVYYFQSLNETEKHLGKQNEFYVYALQEIAANFANQYNPTSSIQYYKQSIAILESIRGENATLNTRINYAEELIKIEKYDEAMAELNEIQQAYIDLDETNTNNYTWCLRIKSRIYERLDDLKNAEDQLLQGLAIVEKMYDEDHTDYATYIRRLGEFYWRNNEVDLAYQYVAPAFEIIENKYGDEALIYAWYAETMSSILYRLDDYAQAVNLQEKAADIYLNQIGEGEDYRDAQYSLGKLFAQLGQYENSIQAIEKSRNSVLKEYGRYSIAYTDDTKEIAVTYLIWDKNEQALAELNTVKNLYDSIGVKRSFYALVYNYMGWALLDMGQLEEGRKHYEMAIQIADSTWGKESGASMQYRNNLAFYYLQKGEYEKAEKLWLESKKESFDSDLSKVAWLDNMAMLYTSWDKLAIAESYWNEINDLLLNKIKEDFPLLSESGKAAFWDAWKKDFETFNSYAVKAHIQGNSKALGQMYDNQLQTKSLLLNTTTKERKRILNSGNKALLDTYNRYISLKENLAKYYGYTSEELTNESIDIASLENQAESLEKALSINSEDERNTRNERSITWKSIQRTLLPNEAAVEIIRFRHFDKVTTDSVIYAALILTSETTNGPILEVLANGDYLEERAIKAYRSAMKFKVQDKRGYSAFWKSIDQHLDGIKQVYLSSDGVYHQLNVSTLQKEDGSYINESYDIRLVSSTRIISELKKRTRTNENQTAYIFGNPKFDLSHTLIEGDLRERGLTNTQSYTRATTLDDFSFSELPGTKVETETVNDVLAKNQWTTNLYLGEDALEEELKRVDNPSILHIATHGFFLDQPDEDNASIQLGVQAEASRKNALLRSGLLMTGATQTAKGEQNRSIENGIFTAYEAMNLDLSSTELVILSACETGLGEIKNGEGVFGLQRAFQIAGAKSILMSLWKVDDAATQLLMTSFYDAWLNGADEANALHQAQEVVKAQYPHPNYWGAFVLVGG